MRILIGVPASVFTLMWKEEWVPFFFLCVCVRFVAFKDSEQITFGHLNR